MLFTLFGVRRALYFLFVIGSTTLSTHSQQHRPSCMSSTSILLYHIRRQSKFAYQFGCVVVTLCCQSFFSRLRSRLYSLSICTSISPAIRMVHIAYRSQKQLLNPDSGCAFMQLLLDPDVNCRRWIPGLQPAPVREVRRVCCHRFILFCVARSISLLACIVSAQPAGMWRRHSTNVAVFQIRTRRACSKSDRRRAPHKMEVTSAPTPWKQSPPRLTCSGASGGACIASTPARTPYHAACVARAP
jgi:hypothetical protein